MIHRVLDLSELSVREIMVPRNDIVSVSVEATLDQVLHAMIEHQHSRLPVYEEKPEQIVGLLHYKDLLPVWEERREAIRVGRPSRTFRIRRLLRKHLVVPETKPVGPDAGRIPAGPFPHGHGGGRVRHHRRTAHRGRRAGADRGAHSGRIRREESRRPRAPARSRREVELDGATRIRDLETEYGIDIPAEAGFETLAGFLLYRLGYIPARGRTRGLWRAALHGARNGAQPHRPGAHRTPAGRKRARVGFSNRTVRMPTGHSC